MKMLAAFNGIEKIDDELTDLDADEIAELERRIDAYSKNPLDQVFFINRQAETLVQCLMTCTHYLCVFKTQKYAPC